jgi:DNA-binding MarR family transcriptional regulator
MIPPSAPGDEKATRVWAALQDYVLAQDRREELREALGLGRGTGRVKALLRLTEGPLSLRDIAELGGVDAPYATLIVDHLEARGLVERTAHPGDRRRKVVTLTAAGREAAALAQQIITQPPPGFAQLSDADLTGLENVVDQLRQTSR